MKYLFLVFFYIFCLSAIAQINFQDYSNILGISSNTGTTIFGGSGVSFVDYNNDGFDDITLASGDATPVRFYKNLDGTFFVEENLLPSTGNYNYKTRSVTWIDFDNDGDKDLFLTSDTNGNKLFENQSNTLVDVTISAGLPSDNIYTYGASWGDIDNNGCLDIYFSNRIGGTTIVNYLFKNNCDGTFSDVTDSIGLTNAPALTFCSTFFDFNNDGYQDLYVANDKFKPNYLYKNNGDGTFTDISQSSGTDVIVDAMSVTIGDFNSDGFFDIFVTNTPNDISTPTLGSILLKNNGDETFTDISVSSGTSLDSFSWGSSFLDADNDGDLDLYVNSQYTQADGYPSYAFFRNDGNEIFSSPNDVGFLNNDYKSYACAVGDYNNDGTQDIIVNNDDNQSPSLWTNTSTSNTNNYISLGLKGVISNRDGIGSVIEISVNGTKQYRQVLAGESYMAQNSLTETIGVGSATIIDYIKVNWLSGNTDTLFNVPVNQRIEVEEGSTLSTNNFDNIGFTYHPNPVKNILTLYAQQNIDIVTMYNVLGQEVLKASPNSVNAIVNMSNLNRGAYFAKVSILGATKTIRIIKQ